MGVFKKLFGVSTTRTEVSDNLHLENISILSSVSDSDTQERKTFEEAVSRLGANEDFGSNEEMPNPGWYGKTIPVCVLRGEPSKLSDIAVLRAKIVGFEENNGVADTELSGENLIKYRLPNGDHGYFPVRRTAFALRHNL